MGLDIEEEEEEETKVENEFESYSESDDDFLTKKENPTEITGDLPDMPNFSKKSLKKIKTEGHSKGLNKISFMGKPAEET